MNTLAEYKAEQRHKTLIKDKIIGIYNRFHIIESDIVLAEKHLMCKYKLTEIEALKKLFNLAFDKKLDLVKDDYCYRHSFIVLYRIKNIKKL